MYRSRSQKMMTSVTATIFFGAIMVGSLGCQQDAPSEARASVTSALTRPVNIHDACDPTTFNASVGPGTCVRAGGVRFADFIADLTRNASVGAWHFAPALTDAPFGETFVAINTGGEVHTFTRVQNFGGGIVDLLNQLARVPNEAQECRTLEPDDFVPPGRTYTQRVDQTGTVKFQCCIHPWMHLEVRVLPP